MKILFLDDERFPADVTWVPYPTDSDFDVVRNYEEFIEAVQANEYDIISFDHDLGEGKTGYDCLKKLCEVHSAILEPLPMAVMHTENSVGAKNMSETYLNFQEYIRRAKRRVQRENEAGCSIGR